MAREDFISSVFMLAGITMLNSLYSATLAELPAHEIFVRADLLKFPVWPELSSLYKIIGQYQTTPFLPHF
jgi:hypothetical protein